MSADQSTKHVGGKRMHALHRTKSRLGFSIIELVTIVVMAASVTAVLGPAMSRMRTQMRGMTSEGNLASIGQISAMYAHDHDDRIFTFTWRAGVPYIDLATGKERVSPTDQEAASRQVQNILHRATGRISGAYKIQVPSARLMHRRYSHLVLADYMGGSVTDPMWADPMDANQLRWQLNPLEYRDDDPNTLPYGNGMPDLSGYDDDTNWQQISIQMLWPFASSFQVVPHAWQQDFGPQYYPIEDTPHLFFQSSDGIVLGERRFHEVRFPGAKVHMFEEFDREQAGSPYFAYDHARPAKLMFDGSINTMMSGLSHSSVNPDHYLDNNLMPYDSKHAFEIWEQPYVPLDTFPIPLGGLGDNTHLNQRFRWTLHGLQGTNYPQGFTRP
tara:strand:+ start:148968 stop:150122 length:1155 start_codon:yes stop_codon:yes gene_type:complete